MLRSAWKLWAHENWATRVEMAVYAVCGTGALVFVAIEVLYGVLTGEWNVHALLLAALLYSVATTWFDSVTWRRRALEAEKPLPPTQVVTTYSTVGAADIARRVEEQRRRESMTLRGMHA